MQLMLCLDKAAENSGQLSENVVLTTATKRTAIKRKCNFMKKLKTTDALRSEYKRSDFGELVRGKYADRITEESNVVLLEPDIARAFPNDEAVNKALRYLLEVAEVSTRLINR